MATKILEKSKLNTNSQPQKLAIYIRVSSDKQKGNASKSVQLKAINNYIAINNWIGIPFEIYDDTQSASHTLKMDLVNDDLDKFMEYDDLSPSIFLRKDLRRLIYDANLKRFDKLLVYSHDRLSRDIYEGLFIRHTLKKLNVEIIYCKPGEQISSGNSSSDIFFENLLNSLAALEANIIGGRTFLGNRTNITNNRWAGGPPPYGYFLKPNPNSYNKNKSILTINPIEAILVKKIFELYNLGYTPQNIATFIKKEYPYNNDRHWTLNSIKSILNNPIYTGTIVWNKKGGSRNPKKKSPDKHIKSSHMKELIIIDNETWNKSIYIRELQKNNPKFLSTQFLLKDIIFCRKCGNALMCKNHGNSSGSVYICNNKNCKKRFTIKTKFLHQLVFNQLTDVLANSILDLEYLNKFYSKYYNEFFNRQNHLIKEKQNLELELANINKLLIKSKEKISYLNSTNIDLSDDEYNKYVCLMESLEEFKIHLKLSEKELINNINLLNHKISTPIIKKDNIKNIFANKKDTLNKIISIDDISLKNRCLRLFVYELIDKILIDADNNVEINFK